MAEAEKPQNEADMLAEWQNMAANVEAAEAAPQVGDKILDQNEIDSLLGIDPGKGPATRGIQALLDQNVVNYEKLPMLEVIFDKFERFISTSLRHFTADNVEVSIVNMTSVRFGDYLNTIPLPAAMVVVNAMGLDDYILLTYESQCIYSVVDILLGGRKARPAKVDGRSFTSIERKIMENLTEVVLNDLSQAFAPIAPVQFKAERMEINPRFAFITQETNVSILVTIRLSLEGREGHLQFCLPYATLEPLREQLLQQFMGEKFGQDNIWENHLSQELYHTSVVMKAVLDTQIFKLSDVVNWRLGDTIKLEAEADSPIHMDCGSVTKLVGKMGRAKSRIAVQVTHSVTDLNNKRS